MARTTKTPPATYMHSGRNAHHGVRNSETREIGGAKGCQIEPLLSEILHLFSRIFKSKKKKKVVSGTGVLSRFMELSGGKS